MRRGFEMPQMVVEHSRLKKYGVDFPRIKCMGRCDGFERQCEWYPKLPGNKFNTEKCPFAVIYKSGREKEG